MKLALHEISTNNALFEEDMKAYREAGWTAFEMNLPKVEPFSPLSESCVSF